MTRRIAQTPTLPAGLVAIFHLIGDDDDEAYDPHEMAERVYPHALTLINQQDNQDFESPSTSSRVRALAEQDLRARYGDDTLIEWGPDSVTDEVAALALYIGYAACWIRMMTITGRFELGGAA